MKPIRQQERGWTLIETLVVIAIVAMLASLVTQALPFIQGKVRDKRRLGDLTNLQRVIEIYKQDTGSYPVGTATTLLTEADGLVSWPGYSTYLVTTDYVPNIVPTYFAKLPVDPFPGMSSISGCQALSYNRNIAYSSNGDHYKLVFNCSSETNDYPLDSRFYDPIRPDSAWAASDDMDYTTFVLGW